SRLYKTGDLVRFLPEGEIEYLGRLDHQVKVRGFRIELGEIEAMLMQHPAVSECVVLVKECPDGERSLIAYLVTRQPGVALAPAELRAHLKRQLPDYMIPSAFVSLVELPLLANGKLDRRALAAAEPESVSSAIYLAPRSALEEAVAGILCEVLRL